MVRDYGKWTACIAQQRKEDEQLKDKVNVMFWNLLPHFQQGNGTWKDPRLRPIVRLVTVTC